LNFASIEKGGQPENCPSTLKPEKFEDDALPVPLTYSQVYVVLTCVEEP
jgi:hypothetical protein